jgi:hypothetical protein
MLTLAILLTLRSLLKRRYPAMIERTNTLLRSNARFLLRLIGVKRAI